MKKTIAIFIVFLVVLSKINAQSKWSLAVYAGSGLSKFGGPGATGVTWYHLSDVSSIPSTAVNPYGNKNIQTWQAGLQAQYQLNNHLVFLLNSQYEHTGGTQDVDTIFSIGGLTKINGEFSLYHDFISINPQFGAAILNKKLRLLLKFGIDYALRIERGEDLEFTNMNGEQFAWGSSGGVPANNEFRVTAGMQMDYNRIGLGVNYKHGLTNARDDDYGKEVYSRTWQFNLYYRFLKFK
jgi:hypothetical protein